jgi:hypothetical protein
MSDGDQKKKLDQFEQEPHPEMHGNLTGDIIAAATTKRLEELAVLTFQSREGERVIRSVVDEVLRQLTKPRRPPLPRHIPSVY